MMTWASRALFLTDRFSYQVSMLKERMHSARPNTILSPPEWLLHEKWAVLWAIFMCYSLWRNKVPVGQCPGTTAFDKKEGAKKPRSKPTSACLPAWCLTAGPDQLTPPPQSFTPLQFRISFSLQRTSKVSVMSKTKDCNERFHFSFWGKFWQLMMQKCPNVYV